MAFTIPSVKQIDKCIPYAKWPPLVSFSVIETPGDSSGITKSRLEKSSRWRVISTVECIRVIKQGKNQEHPSESGNEKNVGVAPTIQCLSQPCKPQISVVNSLKLTNLWDIIQTHKITQNANSFIFWWWIFQTSHLHVTFACGYK